MGMCLYSIIGAQAIKPSTVVNLNNAIKQNKHLFKDYERKEDISQVSAKMMHALKNVIVQ